MKYGRKVLWLFLLVSVHVAGITAQTPTDTAGVSGNSECRFPGGVDSLYACLEQVFRISLTEHSYEQYQDLIGDVRLTINKKGQVVTVNSGGSRIEYELERALMSIPPFIPAMQNGKPVTSYVQLKFMFMIKGNRMEVTQHLNYHTSSRGKDTGWMKAGLIAVSVLAFLLYWGI
ncbi:MAG TPA: hypothetical protein P5228_03705 [Bacteroidales bacterium]|nr:hypothetical protein [Bacteroidales bacterium]HRZ49195.1 hypothetical protein [Bacteroidales bacterium]